MKNMKEFPKFMKREQNKIDNSLSFNKTKEGYFFEGKDGVQMVIWTYRDDTTTDNHIHRYDEYVVCVNGQYKLNINEEEIILNPGDEYFVPANTLHKSFSASGTRTIHSFDGKRYNKLHHVFNNYFK